MKFIRLEIYVYIERPRALMGSTISKCRIKLKNQFVRVGRNCDVCSPT